MRLLIISALVICASPTFSQQISSYVLNNAGTFLDEGEFQFYLSIGETFSTENRIEGIGLNQGFIQIFKEDTSVATADLAKNDINLFPNPTGSFIQYELENGTNYSELILYDVSGNKLMQQKVDSSNNKIDLSHFENGGYFLKFFDKGIPAVSYKIIKQ